MALLRAIFLWKNKEMFHVKRQYSFSGSAKKRFWPVYASLPLSPRKARHFPPSSGEADTKEKENMVYVNRIFTLYG